MITRVHSKKMLLPDGIREENIYLENGKIIQVGGTIEADEVYDFGENAVIPGLTDMHTHGAKGYDFSDTTPEGFRLATEYHLSRGATAIMPTITSLSFESTWKALECAEQALPSCRNVVGIHLEGPYLSPEQCGAQNTAYITAPAKEEYEKITERFGHMIRRWDYAPERDCDNQFCKHLMSKNILPSAAHTNAIYTELKAAYDLGCKLITHLYSCTSTITRDKGFRRLGVTECAYLLDDMYVEIITDGKHLPKELLQLIFKLKPIDRIISVSDSLSIAGADVTSGVIGGTHYLVEDGVCKLADRSAFAGSIVTADRILDVLLNTVEIPLEKAVCVTSENPCRFFGLQKGRIQEGYDADLVVLDQKKHISQVICAGKII